MKTFVGVNIECKTHPSFIGLFDLDLCSKVLKEALLLLILLAWGKHEQNMFHMEQKMFATENAPNGKKMFHGEQKNVLKRF